MRALISTSIGLCAATALASLPALPAAAAPAPLRAEQALPGSTQSLPLASLKSARSTDRGDEGVGLNARDVKPFSLLGVVWQDPALELHGQVQVRTRTEDSEHWSRWQSLSAHTEDAPDPGTAESSGAAVRGGTAPLWVGDSDGVQVRVQPETTRRGAAASLPEGLRVELINPGSEPVGTTRTTQAGAPSMAGAETPALSRTASIAEAVRVNPALPEAARPFVGPRPRIVTRRGWGANEKLREKKFKYTKTVKAAFVHHSASGNGYRCSRAPAVLRSIYRYHVKSQGWADFGYNFAVDKCGRIYEGRAGGITKPVLGAHTLGFNSSSMGIAVLGDYNRAAPSAAAVRAVARLTAWKLGLYGAHNPKWSVTMTSAGSGKYKKGARVKLRVISGHRDGFATECPGARLYGKLSTARSASAHYQGR